VLVKAKNAETAEKGVKTVGAFDKLIKKHLIN
jgi:hypothetical protein